MHVAATEAEVKYVNNAQKYCKIYTTKFVYINVNIIILIRTAIFHFENNRERYK